MLRSSVARWALGLVVVLAVLGLMRFKPWQRASVGERAHLQVGFLPVT